MIRGLTFALAMGWSAMACADAIDRLGLGEPGYGQLAADIMSQALPGGMFCGSAMTQEACTEVKTILHQRVAEDASTLRAVQVKLIERQFGSLDAAAAAWEEQPAGIRQKPVCQPNPLTWRCKTLLDAMFYGGLIEDLKAARAEAARRVPQFYSDGSPFVPEQ